MASLQACAAEAVCDDLEQGPYLRPFQFRHEEVESYFGDGVARRLQDHPQSFRRTPDEEAQPAFFFPPRAVQG